MKEIEVFGCKEESGNDVSGAKYASCHCIGDEWVCNYAEEPMLVLGFEVYFAGFAASS